MSDLGAALLVIVCCSIIGIAIGFLIEELE